MYEYSAEVLRVIDGDTLDCRIDLGFDVWVKKRIRFYGINTPESRTRDLEEKKRGIAAKARVVDLLRGDEGRFILISHGVGKYGRVLGEILIDVEDEVLNVKDVLIAEGHGVEYFGGKR
mgnify:CR=1 FL=1